MEQQQLETSAQGGITQQTQITPQDVPHRGKAKAGMILGIIGLFAWFIPIVGFPMTIVGIVMSAFGLKSDKRGQAIAGLIMSTIGLIASVLNSLVGVILALQNLRT
jgi:hypothetical protein